MKIYNNKKMTGYKNPLSSDNEKVIYDCFEYFQELLNIFHNIFPICLSFTFKIAAFRIFASAKNLTTLQYYCRHNIDLDLSIADSQIFLTKETVFNDECYTFFRKLIRHIDETKSFTENFERLKIVISEEIISKL